MLPNERMNDYEESLRSAVEGLLAGLWVASPGIVQDYNSAAQTVSVQPALQMPVRQPDGTIKMTTLPLLVDVPAQFFRGGGFSVTTPISKGDECLIIFANACIDAWWQQGGIQPPMEARMHDLSDGFAILGYSSQPRVLSNVSTTSMQMRSDDGTVFVDASPDTVTAFAPHVKVHAGTSYSWDVNGYGQKITWTGGTNWTIDNYTTGATVTTNNHAISPPEAP